MLFYLDSIIYTRAMCIYIDMSKCNHPDPESSHLPFARYNRVRIADFYSISYHHNICLILYVLVLIFVRKQNSTTLYKTACLDVI